MQRDCGLLVETSCSAEQYRKKINTMPSIHPSYKDNKKNTHDMLDEVHSGFHAFVDGIESLSVEVNVRSFTGLNSPVI